MHLKTDNEIWREYERRKAELQRRDLTLEEYQEAVMALADRLGI